MEELRVSTSSAKVAEFVRKLQHVKEEKLDAMTGKRDLYFA